MLGLRYDDPNAEGRNTVVQLGLTITDGLAYATDNIACLRGLNNALDDWDSVCQQQGSKQAFGAAKRV